MSINKVLFLQILYSDIFLIIQQGGMCVYKNRLFHVDNAYIAALHIPLEQCNMLTTTSNVSKSKNVKSSVEIIKPAQI